MTQTITALATLENREIILQPGAATFEPSVAGAVATGGVAKLVLVNTGQRDDQFSVKIECDQEFWDPSWVRMSSEGRSPTHMPDRYAAGDQSIDATFVGQGGQRVVLLTFAAPAVPEVRAGVYRFRIRVDSVLGGFDYSDDRPIFGILIVRPYVRYDAAVLEGKRHFGRFRRRLELDLVIENHGNDFLYLDVKPGKEQDISYSSMVQRITIPPPEDGVKSVRTVPIIATTKKKDLKGEHKLLAASMSVVRIDAPGVPPLPIAREKQAVMSAELHRAVLWSSAKPGDGWFPTAELPVPPSLRPEVYYHPLFPTTLPQVGQWIVANAKGLVMLFIGLIASAVLFATIYGNMWFKKGIVDLKALHAAVGDSVFADSKGLPLTYVHVYFMSGSEEAGGAYFTLARNGLKARYQFVVPNLKPGNYKLAYQRDVPPGFWPGFIQNAWKITNTDTTFTVDGDPKTEVDKASGEPLEAFGGGKYTVSWIDLNLTEGFGAKRGTVSYTGSAPGQITVSNWTNDKIELDPLPIADVGAGESGTLFNCVIQRSDGSKIPFKLRIKPKMLEGMPGNMTPLPGEPGAIPTADSTGGSGGGGTSSGTTGSSTGGNTGGSDGGGGSNAAAALPPGFDKLITDMKSGDYSDLASLPSGVDSNDALRVVGQAAARQFGPAGTNLDALPNDSDDQKLIKSIATAMLDHFKGNDDNARDDLPPASGKTGPLYAIPNLMQLNLLNTHVGRSELIQQLGSMQLTDAEKSLVPKE